jgi:hypothetical protein
MTKSWLHGKEVLKVTIKVVASQVIISLNVAKQSIDIKGAK